MQRTLRLTLVLIAFLALTASPAAAQDALHIDANGKVGIGTETPDAPLHVYRDDGSAQLVVQDDSPTAQARTLFTLRNNGGSRFAFVNTGGSSIWQFSALSNFNIDFNGNPGNELQVQQDGDLVIGGDLYLPGTVQSISSREAKTNLVAVDASGLLARLGALPLYEWSYKNDREAARHVGPTAEDFHAAFGLGADDRHIALGDKAGVALVAVQGLLALLERKDSEIEALAARLAAVEAALGERQGGAAD